MCRSSPGIVRASTNGTPSSARYASQANSVVRRRWRLAATPVSSDTMIGLAWVESGAGKGVCDPNQKGSPASGGA